MMSEALELGSHKPLETKVVCKNYTPKPTWHPEALIASLHSLHVKICSSLTLVPISYSDPSSPCCLTLDKYLWFFFPFRLKEELAANHVLTKNLQADLQRKEEDYAELKEKLTDAKKQIEQVQKEVGFM